MREKKQSSGRIYIYPCLNVELLSGGVVESAGHNADHTVRDIQQPKGREYLLHILANLQCCGSGSDRIRIIWPDPDSHRDGKNG